MESGRRLELRRLEGPEREHTALGFDDIETECLPWFADTWWPGRERDYLVASDGDGIRAGALVTTIRVPVATSGLAVVRGGPYWRYGGSAEPGDYERMVELLKAEYAFDRRFMLSIQPPTDPEYGPQMADMLLQAGFEPGHRNPSPETYLVDLTVPADDILAAARQKWRYNLKKAQRAGLTFELDDTPAGLERFFRLYAVMKDRKKFVDTSPVAVLPAMFEAHSPSARPRICLVRHGETDVAGAVVGTAGRTASYLYGASGGSALELCAGYFLHWNIVTWLQGHTGCRWYTLGSTAGSPGLRQFKGGLVGRSGIVVDEPPFYRFAVRRRAIVAGGLLDRMRGVRAAVRAVRSALNWR